MKIALQMNIITGLPHPYIAHDDTALATILSLKKMGSKDVIFNGRSFLALALLSGGNY